MLGRKQRTFHVSGHHYALVPIEDLEPGSEYPYEVRLDGELRWPEPGSDLPPSVSGRSLPKSSCESPGARAG